MANIFVVLSEKTSINKYNNTHLFQKPITIWDPEYTPNSNTRFRSIPLFDGSRRFGKRRFGKNMAAEVSAKKRPERLRLNTFAETFLMIFPVYARSPSPSQRPASTTIASRSPFPLGLCSCSTSLSKMGT